MSDTPDLVLWERVRNGDVEAFGALFVRHSERVYAFCFRRSGDRFAADDLTSLTFLETWRCARRVTLSGDSVLPWLLGVANNVIRNQARARRRHEHALRQLPPLDAEMDFVASVADQLALENEARAALETLSDLPRGELDAFTLVVFGGLSGQEAAAALGIPESTLRTRIFRARQRLARALATPDFPRSLGLTERNL